jgi:hypothetical protein
MAYVSWPSSLPATGLLTGFTYKLPDGRTINSVSTGMGRRRAFWRGFTSFHIAMHLTQAQFNRLLRFWEEDTNHGIDIFIMVDAARSGPVLSSSGEPLLSGTSPLASTVKVLVRFTGDAPSITSIESFDCYKVEFDIEVMP